MSAPFIATENTLTPSSTLPVDEQVGGPADHRGRQANGAVELQRGVARIVDVEDVGERAVRGDRKHADAVVRLAGDEHVSRPVDDRGGDAGRAVELQRRRASVTLNGLLKVSMS